MSTGRPRETIRWETMQHYNQHGAQIREALHTLHHGPVADMRQAMEVLFDIQEYTVCETVPHIIALTSPLLADDNFPGIMLLLEYLAEFLKDVQLAVGFFTNMAMAYLSTVYPAIRTYLHDIIRHLDHPDTDVRCYAAELLGRMYDDFDIVSVAFCERYMRESDTVVQRVILEQLYACAVDDRNILEDRPPEYGRKQTDTQAAVCWFVSGVLYHTYDQTQRFRAARIYLVCSVAEVPDAIISALQAGIEAGEPFLDRELMKDLMRLPASQLVQVLDHAAFSPERTVRLLLQYIRIYDLVPLVLEFAPGTNTLTDSVITRDDPWHQSRESAQKFMQVLLECENYWQAHSNLLSYIWNLPDDRDFLITHLSNLEEAS